MTHEEHTAHRDDHTERYAATARDAREMLRGDLEAEALDAYREEYRQAYRSHCDVRDFSELPRYTPAQFASETRDYAAQAYGWTGASLTPERWVRAAKDMAEFEQDAADDALFESADQAVARASRSAS